MRFFFDVSRSVSETKINCFKTKMFLFRKHLRNESVFETKVKLFLVHETISLLFFFKKIARNKNLLG